MNNVVREQSLELAELSAKHEQKTKLSYAPPTINILETSSLTAGGGEFVMESQGGGYYS